MMSFLWLGAGAGDCACSGMLGDASENEKVQTARAGGLFAGR
jgi:hypothetical protein